MNIDSLIPNSQRRDELSDRLGTLVREGLPDGIYVNVFQWHPKSRHPAVAALYLYGSAYDVAYLHEMMRVLLLSPEWLLRDHLSLRREDSTPFEEAVFEMWDEFSPFSEQAKTLSDRPYSSAFGLFYAQLPPWVNTFAPHDVEGCLKRCEQVGGILYALTTQTGIHSLIEWTGVVNEHVKMLEWAWVNDDIDPREVDQHSRKPVEAPGYMVNYFCEKLGCQIKPFIRASPQTWRTAIELWFR